MYFCTYISAYNYDVVLVCSQILYTTDPHIKYMLLFYILQDLTEEGGEVVEEEDLEGEVVKGADLADTAVEGAGLVDAAVEGEDLVGAAVEGEDSAGVVEGEEEGLEVA